MSQTLRTDFNLTIQRTLHTNWEQIVGYRLTQSERCFIPGPPQIILIESSRMLGCWKGRTTNVIELNLDLVLEHPWYAVLDVFYHEVAHQLKDFLYPDLEEGPHGKMFRKLCQRIGANPDPKSEYSELDIRLFSGHELDAADSLIEKIKKLLNLAEGGDEHEAEVALSKAMMLMAKHGISEDDLKGDGESYCTISVGEPVATRNINQQLLANLLGNFWSVFPIWDLVPVPGEYNGFGHVAVKRILMLNGTVRNVKIAAYVYDYILNFIQKAWRSYWVNNMIRPTQRAERDFTYGVLSGLYSKLDCQLRDKNVYALVHKGEAGLQEYKQCRYPAMSVTRRHGIRVDRAVAEDGREIGRNMEINPGLENSSPKTTKQLHQ